MGGRGEGGLALLAGVRAGRDERQGSASLGSTKFGSLVCVTSFFDGDGMARWHGSIVCVCERVCVRGRVLVHAWMMGRTGRRGQAKKGLRPREKTGKEARRSSQSVPMPPRPAHTPCGDDLKGNCCVEQGATAFPHCFLWVFSFFV